MCHHQVCFIQSALQHRLGLRDEETGERLNEKYNKQKWLVFFESFQFSADRREFLVFLKSWLQL